MAQSLERSVIEVEVSQIDLRRGKTLGIDCKSVVVRGDLHPAGAHVLDGLVTAAVTELELVASPTKRKTEKLMTQADSENRRCTNQLLYFAYYSGNRSRIAGPIRKKDSIGRKREDIFR